MSSDRWYFEKGRLADSPSRRHGISEEKEQAYLQQTANFIQEMGRKLSLSLLCINTAVLFTQRFYVYHSLTIFEKYALGASALFLAAKVEEHPRKLEHVCQLARLLGPGKTFKEADFIEDLLRNENALLQTLGFELQVQHPHHHVLKLCECFKASKDFMNTSYIFATYCLHLTNMCLMHKPTRVACLCIYIATKMTGWVPASPDGRPWFLHCDPGITEELLESLCGELDIVLSKCPEKCKNKTLQAYGKLVKTPANMPVPGSVTATPDKTPETEESSSLKLARNLHYGILSFASTISQSSGGASCESMEWSMDEATHDPSNKPAESGITLHVRQSTLKPNKTEHHSNIPINSKRIADGKPLDNSAFTRPPNSVPTTAFNSLTTVPQLNISSMSTGHPKVIGHDTTVNRSLTVGSQSIPTMKSLNAQTDPSFSVAMTSGHPMNVGSHSSASIKSGRPQTLEAQFRESIPSRDREELKADRPKITAPRCILPKTPGSQIDLDRPKGSMPSSTASKTSVGPFDLNRPKSALSHVFSKTEMSFDKSNWPLHMNQSKSSSQESSPAYSVRTKPIPTISTPLPNASVQIQRSHSLGHLGDQPRNVAAFPLKATPSVPNIAERHSSAHERSKPEVRSTPMSSGSLKISIPRSRITGIQPIEPPRLSATPEDVKTDKLRLYRIPKTASMGSGPTPNAPKRFKPN